MFVSNIVYLTPRGARFIEMRLKLCLANDFLGLPVVDWFSCFPDCFTFRLLKSRPKSSTFDDFDDITTTLGLLTNTLTN